MPRRSRERRVFAPTRQVLLAPSANRNVRGGGGLERGVMVGGGGGEGGEGGGGGGGLVVVVEVVAVVLASWEGGVGVVVVGKGGWWGERGAGVGGWWRGWEWWLLRGSCREQMAGGLQRAEKKNRYISWTNGPLHMYVRIIKKSRLFTFSVFTGRCLLFVPRPCSIPKGNLVFIYCIHIYEYVVFEVFPWNWQTMCSFVFCSSGFCTCLYRGWRPMVTGTSSARTRRRG